MDKNILVADLSKIVRYYFSNLSEANKQLKIAQAKVMAYPVIVQ